jgi:AAA domain
MATAAATRCTHPECFNDAMGQVQPGNPPIDLCLTHYKKAKGIGQPKTNGQAIVCARKNCQNPPRQNSDYCLSCYRKITPEAKIADGRKHGKHLLTPEDEIKVANLKAMDENAAYQEALEKREKNLEVEKGRHEIIRHVEEIGERQFLTQITVINADEVQVAPLEWLYPGRIPAGVPTFYVGKPGNAKSLSVTDLVARVSSGADFPDCKNPNGPRKVLMYAGEDPIKQVVIPRLKAAGAYLPNVKLLDGKSLKVLSQEGELLDKREIDLSQDIPVINHLIVEHRDIALLVIDPVTGCFGSKNTNKDEEMRPVFNELKDMLEKRNLTLVAVAHTNKRSDASAIHQIQGCSSMAAAPRAAWLFSHDPDSDDEHAHVMTCIKGNWAEKHDGLKLFTHAVEVEGAGKHPMIQWGESTPMQADDANQALKEKRETKNDKRGTAKTLILALIHDAPMTSIDIYKACEQAGLMEKTYKRAAQDLTDESTIIRRQKQYHGKKVWWMALPQHADQFEYKPDAKIAEQEEL